MIVAGANRYSRTQQNSRECSRAVGPFFHRADRRVPVFQDAYFVDRAQMQVPEHVAGRQARDQQLFRVVASGIAAKAWIAGCRDYGLAFRKDRVVAAIAFVAAGSFAIVAGPLELQVISVLLHRPPFPELSRVHASDTARPASTLSTTMIN